MVSSENLLDLYLLFEDQMANNTSFYNLEVLFLACDRSLGFSQKSVRKGHRRNQAGQSQVFLTCFSCKDS